MFNGFANVWTPIEPAYNLTHKPIKQRLAGEDIVLFRGKDGKVGALIDRCPHRSVAFSIGHTCSDGTIECPFHGWRFDTEGSCTYIPFNPMNDAKRSRFNALALPTREVGGLIWAYTGFDDPPELEVTPMLANPAMHFHASVFTWKTHWTRGLENMLDFPHLPFAHRRTIGRQLNRELTPTQQMSLNLEDTPWGYTIETRVDGKRQAGFLEFRRPNLSILTLEFPRRSVVIHIFAVPIDAEHTRMFLVRTIPTPRFRWLWNVMGRLNQKIIFEDQLVVETTSPVEVPEPGVEKSVATDGPTLAFRKYYHHTLRKSGFPHPWDTPRSLPPGTPELAV